MNNPTPACSEPIKLGIGCVYFYGEQGGWVLDLHLEYLARTLQGYDYTIYAGANRLQAQLRRRLECTPRVTVVHLPWYDGVGNREHGFYLDQLLWRAVEDGCTHIAAFDCDSFPILAGWPRYLLRKMGSDIRLAAVLRSENRDTHLPHPCGYFMQRSFLLERRPSLYPEQDLLAAPDFRSFLVRTSQRVDTGIGYGYVLWKSGEPWLQLRRSNKTDLHFLMAGIYGDVFFHLGASSRSPAFHVDYLTQPALRLAERLRERALVWRAGAYLEDRYLAANTRVLKLITDRLQTDPQQFIRELAGSAPSVASDR
jgi:hypothetical protein